MYFTHPLKPFKPSNSYFQFLQRTVVPGASVADAACDECTVLILPGSLRHGGKVGQKIFAVPFEVRGGGRDGGRDGGEEEKGTREKWEEYRDDGER